MRLSPTIFHSHSSYIKGCQLGAPFLIQTHSFPMVLTKTQINTLLDFILWNINQPNVNNVDEMVEVYNSLLVEKRDAPDNTNDGNRSSNVKPYRTLHNY